MVLNRDSVLNEARAEYQGVFGFFLQFCFFLPTFKLIGYFPTAVIWCSVVSNLQAGKESADKYISINKSSAMLKGKMPNVTSIQLMTCEDLLLLTYVMDTLELEDCLPEKKQDTSRCHIGL